METDIYVLSQMYLSHVRIMSLGQSPSPCTHQNHQANHCEQFIYPSFSSDTRLCRSVCLPYIRIHHGCANIHHPYSTLLNFCPTTHMSLS